MAHIRKCFLYGLLFVFMMGGCVAPDGTPLVQVPTSTPSPAQETPVEAEQPAGHIVFGSRSDGNMDLYIMQPDGSGSMRLSQGETWDGFPTPSPDGQRIVFVAEVMDSQRTPIERDLYVVNTDGSGLMNLTDYPGFDMEPDWSPDGTRLAFSSTRDGDGYTSSIWIMAADGSDVQRLVENAGRPAWSPDGDKIAYVQDGQIYLLQLSAGTTSQLTGSTSPSPQAVPNGNPVWSPDGSRIAFESNRDGNGEIYRMNADGTDQINLTDHPGYDAGPVWSPDGSRLAFTSDRDGMTAIYVMQADGSGAVKVTESSSGEFLPTWSPDGNWLAFVAGPAEQVILRVRLDEAGQSSGDPEPLTPSQSTFPVWIP